MKNKSVILADVMVKESAAIIRQARLEAEKQTETSGGGSGKQSVTPGRSGGAR